MPVGSSTLLKPVTNNGHGATLTSAMTQLLLVLLFVAQHVHERYFKQNLFHDSEKCHEMTLI